MIFEPSLTGKFYEDTYLRDILLIESSEVIKGEEMTPTNESIFETILSIKNILSAYTNIFKDIKNGFECEIQDTILLECRHIESLECIIIGYKYMTLTDDIIVIHTDMRKDSIIYKVDNYIKRLITYFFCMKTDFFSFRNKAHDKILLKGFLPSNYEGILMYVDGDENSDYYHLHSDGLTLTLYAYDRLSHIANNMGEEMDDSIFDFHRYFSKDMTSNSNSIKIFQNEAKISYKINDIDFGILSSVNDEKLDALINENNIEQIYLYNFDIRSFISNTSLFDKSSSLYLKYKRKCVVYSYIDSIFEKYMTDTNMIIILDYKNYELKGDQITLYRDSIKFYPNYRSFTPVNLKHDYSEIIQFIQIDQFDNNEAELVITKAFQDKYEQNEFDSLIKKIKTMKIFRNIHIHIDI